MNYYSESLFNSVYAQRKRLIIVYSCVAFLYLLLSVGSYIWYAFMPYNSPKINMIKIIHGVITFVFIFFSFLFFEIPFYRANKFYQMLAKMKYDKREVGEGKFFDYNDKRHVKDGVDTKFISFVEWNKYKEDYYERRVYVFYELPFPEIPKNAYVRYETQSGMLVNFEVLEILDDEEVEFVKQKNLGED